MEPIKETPPFSVPPPPAASNDAVIATDQIVGNDVIGNDVIDAEVGQLTAGWSTVFWVGWLLIAAAFAAIWYSSRLIGLSTWWLGPATDPQLILISLFPFTVPLALMAGGYSAQRWLPWWGIGGAGFVAVIAAFDVSRVPGFAAIEFGLAIAGLFISVACFAGVFGRAE
ncbi:MAG: hypothetical protein LH616_10670 [Ilumatobacteraceae bacterium]|nr:hypothetical protein [Ilumatobacteraceae bacterium]